MKCLALSRTSTYAGGRRVREMCFEDRSSLPSSAACVVASGARETLGTLLARPVHLRLFEPVLPSPDAWRAILAGALLYRYRGTVADAAIVLRPRDALALARAAFGETSADSGDAPLSPLESDVLARVVAAIGASLPAVCGVRDGVAIERVDEIGAYTTFFELLLDRPVCASIGVAVSRDPAPEPRGALDLTDLEQIRLPLTVTVDIGAFPALEIMALQPGHLLAAGPGPLRGKLRLSGRTLASGTCGVRHGCYAFAVEGNGLAL
ncbi:MAG TPA: hypothetical protein VK760_01920 [Candidatus Acidoferrales bacterium]|jgi:hypothetical protein|nr:hypothetical protein [Candidatus Acidoferrales bacterium]